MSDVSGVIAAADEVQKFCQSQGWRFCFIGGIAVQRWGMPRFTQDVDLTLMTGLGTEEVFVDSLLKKFTGRISNARQFALERRVLLARTADGIDLDVALGAFPFEEESIQRSSPWKINEQFTLITCSAEDLIIHKAFAARDRDWSDVESILVRQHGLLDLTRIRKELPPLLELKESPEYLDRLERMIAATENRLKP